MGDRYYCDECGERFVIDPDSGVANHLNDDDTVDYDADEDHVPHGDEPCGEEDDGIDDIAVFGDEETEG